LWERGLHRIPKHILSHRLMLGGLDLKVGQTFKFKNELVNTIK